MKKNYMKNGVTYTLTNSEKKNILEVYSLVERLLIELDNFTNKFKPQVGKVFRIRINEDEVLSFDELEDLVIMIEKMSTTDSVSLCLEDKNNYD